ncbi:M56 family metallopeptidase [Marinicella rhabdoformis]|uniref:M56 family metallopeptidase n=1 Tax=Marinicella rhabdoformis TaxID=2580566 RepID=UPI0012AEBF55|nr:M56 family metallopeptidase [Marinicella rhabdoformis]
MTEYLIINITISIWALLIHHFLLTDARHQFIILLVAMASWLIPFGWFQFSTEVTVLTATQTIIEQITQPVHTLTIQSESHVSWTQIMMAICSMGICLFIKDLLSLRQQHHTFEQQAQSTDIQNVFTINGLNNACVTGFRPSIIWIDEALFNSEAQISILAHEQQHIRQHDPYWLLLITFIQRLFWFNPIVWLLSKKCQHSLEMRCDQACKKQLPQGLYQNHLAQTLLKMQSKNMPLSNWMAQSGTKHLQRIQQLSKETTMKKHHKYLLALSFTAITLLSAAVLANKTISKVDQNNFPGIGANQVYLEFKFNIDEKETQELSILVENGTEGSVKIDDYTFSFTPHIIKQATASKEKQKTMANNKAQNEANVQIYTEISVHQDKKAKTEISNMSLMSLSNTWASFKINDPKKNEAITAELRATTLNNPDA